MSTSKILSAFSFFSGGLRASLTTMLLIHFFSCSSQLQKVDSLTPDVPDEEYLPVLNPVTKEDKKYSGFQNDYQVHLTLLTADVRSLAVQRRSHFMQWSKEK